MTRGNRRSREAGETAATTADASRACGADDCPATADDDQATIVEALRESERRYRSLFDHLLNGYAHCRMILDEHGRPVDFVYQSVNPAFGRLTGLKDVVGKPVSETIPGLRESSPELFASYARMAATGESETFEVELESLGMWFFISAYSTEPGCFDAVFENITGRKQAEEELRESEERFRSLFEDRQAVMLLIDPEGGAIVDANPAASAWYGWSRAELLAMHIGEINTLPEPEVRAEMERTVTRQRSTFLFQHRRADGTVRDVEVYSAPIEVQGKTLLYSLVHDVTERKRTEEALRLASGQTEAANRELTSHAAALEEANAAITRLAATDNLTGLANRRHFYVSLGKAVSLARRHGSPLALASFDLDGLKRVNDSVGHEAGDEVLTSFATLLGSLCRAEDLPGRLGGDEFSVLLPGIDQSGALKLAARVHAAVRSHTVLHERGVTVSGGVAQWSPDELPDDLLRRADEALYAAKRGGGDSVAGDG